MSTILRWTIAVVFGLLGFCMLVVAVSCLIYGIGALFGGTRDEYLTLFTLALVAGSFATVWILVALRISRVLRTRASIAEMLLAVVILIGGAVMLVLNFYPQPPRHPAALTLAVLVLIGGFAHTALAGSTRSGRGPGTRSDDAFMPGGSP